MARISKGKEILDSLPRLEIKDYIAKWKRIAKVMREARQDTIRRKKKQNK